MKRKLWVLLAFLCMTEWTFAQGEPQWPEVTREMKPGSRWWWMGSAVDADNLKWNIAEYAKTGIGTLEITPIYGVTGNESHELTYLSSGWMDALKVCQTAGDDSSVDIDMNGGTGWPFGGPWVTLAQAAGKLVTKNETKTGDGATVLSFDVSSPEANASLNKVMAFQQDGGQQAVDVTEYVDGKMLKWTAPAGEWLLLAVYNGHTGQQVKRAAPGGEGYVLDHYDADAVKSYLQHFDSRFTATGARWPHTFFNDSYEVYGADWTPKMFSEFEKYRGYKLEEHMDQLLALGKRKDTGNQVLADYRQTLSDMLLNNFTRQWTEWAHSHGVTTRNQGHGSPGNLIDFYAAVDIPEIEGFGITNFNIRGLRTDPGFTSQNLSDLATLKYASSAAHITGKKMTSSETFTWLAEHFRVSLSQMKPEVDLMFIAGVNHIFFHGTTYSPQEAVWPGWKFYASVDMSPTNSIWRDASEFMQYATRCQSFLQMGQPDNDLLVYAPFQDAMHKNTGANAARLQLFDINTLSQKIPSMVTAVNNVEAAGLDCDFISDELLLTTTFVDGMLQTAAGARYRGLIVPVSTNLPEAVKAHLDELTEQGAKIVYKNDAASVASLGVQGEEIRTALGLRMIRRKNETGYHYFITNLSRDKKEGMVSLAVPFIQAWLYNPMTGSISRATVEDGKLWLSLKSGESIILRTFNDGTGGGVMPQTTDVPVVEMEGISINSKWTLSFTDDSYPAEILDTYELDKPSTWEQLDAATAKAMGTGIYETTFNVTQQLLSMANAGMRLDLGDVRESARVYLNGEYVGCAWSAPFVLDITGKLQAGVNTLRVEVTNLPANRIRQMDLDGVVWRKFKDVNILDIVNGNTSQSGITYNNWSLVPSGLNGAVKLVPLRHQSSELKAELKSFVQDGQDFYPTYQLTAPSGQELTEIVVTDEEGNAFNDYALSADKTLLTVQGACPTFIVVIGKDAAGNESSAYLHAYGAYDQVRLVDFTKDEALACGWQVMTNKIALSGFTVTDAWRRAPAGSSGKTEIEVAEGVVVKSAKASFMFCLPSYGMGVTNDFELHAAAQQGDVALLSYLLGTSSKVDYNAADSLTLLMTCADDANEIVYDLFSRSSYYVYRMLQQYRPRQMPTSIVLPKKEKTLEPQYYYTLQGIRIAKPIRGLYIRNGRKVVVK